MSVLPVGEGTVLVLEGAIVVPLHPDSPSREHAIIWAVMNSIGSLDRETLQAMTIESDAARADMERRGEDARLPIYWNRALHSLLELHVEGEIARA